MYRMSPSLECVVGGISLQRVVSGYDRKCSVVCRSDVMVGFPCQIFCQKFC